MKIEALKELYGELLAETEREYNITADGMVFGDGNPEACVLLVGEAPGAEEIRQKKPFVGKAGENLTEFLKELGLAREDIYITNVVKFRTYTESPSGRRKNRTPTPKEQLHQSDFLHREIALIRPKIVVTLGNVALRAVCRDKKALVGSLHGSEIQVTACDYTCRLFSLYHPASIIYNRSLKDIYLADLKALKCLVDGLA